MSGLIAFCVACGHWHKQDPAAEPGRCPSPYEKCPCPQCVRLDWEWTKP